MTLKLFSIYVFLKTVFCPCHKTEINSQNLKKHSSIHKSGRIVDIVNEGSGIISLDSSTFYTHNDGGGKGEIYKVDNKGELLATYKLPCKNIDWEEISKDEKGVFYIGDIGNNNNSRKDLCIYTTPNDLSTIIDTIGFVYADQSKFPPKRENRNFDCEAFFPFGDSLFLFSKNRGKGPVKIYAISKIGKNQKAVIRQALPLKGMVTACTYQPTIGICAILTYGKIYFYKVSPIQESFQLQFVACRKFPRASQSEGITFVNDHLLAISNEGGKLYFMSVDKNFWRVDNASQK